MKNRPLQLFLSVLVLLLGTAFQSAFAQRPITFKIERSATGTYSVFMKSTTAYSGISSQIASSQITLVVPTGSFIGTNYTSTNAMAWSVSTRKNAPTENTSKDYLSFSMSNTYSRFDIPVATDILLFTFSDGGTCPGPISLWSSADPFQGVSTTTNPGNSITLFGFPSGNAYAGNYGTATACAAATVPDLAVTIGTIPNMTVDQVTQIPVTISNVGTAPTNTTLAFNTTLPANFTTPTNFSAGNGWGCTRNNQNILCANNGVLAANGGSSTFNIPVTPSAGAANSTPSFSGSIDSVTGETVVNNNLSASVSPSAPVQPAPVATAPNLGVTMGPIPTMTAGSPTNVPVTVTNNGTASATGPITFTTILPAGTSAPASFTSSPWSCATAGQTVSCTNTNPTGLAPSTSSTLSIPVTPNVSIVNQTPTFTGSVSPAPGQTTFTGINAPSVSPSLPVQPAPVTTAPNLGVTMGPIPTMTAGSPTNVPVTVTNNGTASATGPITFTTILPAGTSAPASFTSSPWSCATTGQTVACTNTNPTGLAPSASSTLAIPVTPNTSIVNQTPTFTGSVSPAPGQTTFTGINAPSVSPSLPVQPAATSNTPNVVVTMGPVPTLTANLASNIPVTLTNTGTAPATGLLTFTTNLPTNMSAPSNFNSGPWNCSTNQQTVFCSNQNTAGIAPNGGVSTIGIPVTPSAAAVGTTPVFSGTANAPAGQTNTSGLTSPNVSPSITVQPAVVTGSPNVVVTIGTVPAMTAGLPAIVPVNMVNNGTSSATGPLVFITTLPAGVTAPSAGFTSGAWSCTVNGQVVTCNNPNSLSPNTSTSINLQVTPSSNLINQTPSFTGTLGTPSGQTNVGNLTANPTSSATPIAAGSGGGYVCNPANADCGLGIRYGLKLNSDGVSYTVYLKSANAYSGAQALISTGQVTIALPTGTNISAATSLQATMTWSSSTRINRPTENPNYDFVSVGLTPNNGVLNIPANVEIPLFTFQRTNACGGSGLYLWHSNEAFKGVSSQTNPGNQMTMLGYGNTNAWQCNYTCEALCTSASLTATQTITNTTQSLNTSFGITINIVNNGTASTVGNVTYVTTLPAGFVFQSGGGNGWNCTANNQVVTCVSSTSIPNNAGSTNFVINVTPTVVGPFSFNGVVSGGGTLSSSNASPANVLIVNAPSDLSIAISQPGAMTLANSNYLNVTVSNSTGSAGGPINVTIQLPNGIVMTNAAAGPVNGTNGWSCLGSAQTITCTRATGLTAGQSAMIVIPITPQVASVNQSLLFQASVGVASNETITGNNQTIIVSNTVVQVSDLASSFGTIPALVAGQTTQIPVIIVNNGAGSVTSPLIYEFTVPSTMTVTGTSAAGWLANGSQANNNGTTTYFYQNSTLTGGAGVQPNQQINLPIGVVPSIGQTGTVNFRGNIAAVISEINTSNNPSVATGTLGSVDLSLTLGSLSPSPTVGQTSSMLVTINNIGTAAAQGLITVGFTLPVGYAMGNAPSGWSIISQINNSNGTTTVTLQRSTAGLGVGQNTSLIVNVTPNASAANQLGTIVVNVTPESGETQTGNNQGQLSVNTSSPQIQIVVQIPQNISVGQISNIIINITNTGNGAYSGPINFQMTLPAGVSIGTLPNGWSILSQVAGPNGTIIYTFTNPSVNLPAGTGNFTVNIPVIPNSSMLGQQFTINIITSVVPGFSTPVINLTFTSPTVTPSVAPNIIINVGTLTNPFSVGQTSILPIIFNNTGNSPASSPLSVTINLPAGVSVNPAQLPNGWTIISTTTGANGGTVVVLGSNTASIPQNTQLTLNISLQTSQAASGTNPSITINMQPQGQTNNSTFTFNSTQQVAAPNVVIIVGQPNPQMQGGQNSFIPVYLYNAGNGTAFGPLNVQINLPAGININQAQLPNGWTVSNTQNGANGTTIVTLTNPNTSGLTSLYNLLFNVPVVPNNTLVNTSPTFTFVLQPVQGQTSTSSQTITINLPILSGSQPDFTVTSSQISPALQVGQTSNMVLTINNVGTANYSGQLSTQVSVPAGYVISQSGISVGWTLGAGVAGANNSVTYTLTNNNASINAGSSTTINVGIVPSQANLSQIPTFTFMVVPPASESNTGNNSGSVTAGQAVSAASAPDLAVVLPSQSFSLATGQVSNVSFNVTNVGNIATSGGLNLSFTMPSGFTTSPSSFTTGGWSCNTNANIVTCTNLSTINASSSTSLVMPVLPTAAAAGAVNPSFVINVTQAGGEVQTGNNTGTIQYNGTVQSLLSDLTATFPQQSFTLSTGQVTNITFEVRNIGSAATGGTLSLSMMLPANFTTAQTSFNTNAWSCTISGQNVICTSSTAINGFNGVSSLTIPVLTTPQALGMGNPGFTVMVAQASNETVTVNNTASLLYNGTVTAGATAINVKALLQGAFNPITGLMDDKLRVKNLIPLQQSYNNGNLGLQSYLYTGAQTTTSSILSVTGDNAIVDWVLVELRNATNPSQIVAATAALIQRDGDIVNPADGISGISFAGIGSGNYYVAVRHRNHLGVMTANTINMSNSSALDLTDMNNLYKLPGAGNFPAIAIGNKVGMWGGNTNGNDTVVFQGGDSDVNPTFFQVFIDPSNFSQVANYLVLGYNRADINLDGKTVFQGPDNEVDMIFFNVVTHRENTGFLANFIIRQHLP